MERKGNERKREKKMKNEREQIKMKDGRWKKVMEIEMENG